MLVRQMSSYRINLFNIDKDERGTASLVVPLFNIKKTGN